MPSIKLAEGVRRSPNEYAFEKELQKRYIKYIYEPETVKIFPEYVGTVGTVAAITYTPDFYFQYKGHDIYIEVKGYPEYIDYLKEKLADYHYSRRGKKYFMVSPFGSVKLGTKNWYLSRYCNVVSKRDKRLKNNEGGGKPLQTIWDILEKL